MQGPTLSVLGDSVSVMGMQEVSGKRVNMSKVSGVGEAGNPLA